MPPRAAGGHTRVQSLDRALGLLDLLADAGRPLGLSELASAGGLPVSTTHRMLASLTASGHLHQAPDRRYRLGPRLVALGGAAMLPVGPDVPAWLSQLVASTGETTNAATLCGDAVLFVAQVQSAQAMRTSTEDYRRTLPHCSAVGKALLSLLPDSEVVSLADRVGLPRRTSRTIDSVEGLLWAVAQVRLSGYAVDDEEEEYGARCVAVPVPAAPFPLAVSVSGPTSRVTPERVPAIASELARVVRAA
ncbi:IclR family transcriptional regulator [Nocardioides gansuensis]|uniref:Glycerol operon regulatory protein n=1 Tax=Nocardioides gansuensis TaxID=2138300 RepID=A0A2T8FFL6_9ACTN|nr:IclR family transcriptional regulator [Nocardioides gansuensis]PVG84511.1 IclR family transcriptional regulator [Nocardioides gansuensis]